MVLDWKEYRTQILNRVAEVGRLSPDTVRGYRQMSGAGAATGRLDPKTREMIALAVAVTRQCDGCIIVHTEAAIKAGATREEIAEALGVAVSVNAGAALMYSGRVIDAYAATAAAAQNPAHHEQAARSGSAVSGEDVMSEAEIDRNLMGSFPASDPPSWTLGIADTDPPSE